MVILYDDIINYICYLSNIKCHVCNKKFNIYFKIKLDKNYYCSNSCFNFV